MNGRLVDDGNPGRGRPLGKRSRSRWSRAIEALVLPSHCLICGAGIVAEPLCDACRAELMGASGGACRRCGLEVGPWGEREAGCGGCRGRRLGFDSVIALGPYQGPIRDLCLRLKREKEAWLAPWLIDVLMEAGGDRLVGEAAECVVPVPLHWWRRLSRGYDQADALASSLAGRLGLRLVRPLRRVVRTEKLARLGRSERAEIMRGAFRAGRDRRVEGRTVLLVDDILTTGATCGAAARALKKAGAKRVVVAVIGRAEGRR